MIFNLVYAVTLWAVVARMAAGDGVADFLVFDKQQPINLDDSAHTTLGISLKDAPIGEVALFYQAANTRFGPACSMRFNAQNYKTPQQLTIMGVPFASVAPEGRQIPINFTLYADSLADHPAAGDTMVVQTQRGPGASGHCEVTGDPHIRTFDQTSATLNFQGHGDYYLVKGNSLVIQSRQGNCGGNGATCVLGLGIRYGTTVLVLDPSAQDQTNIVSQLSLNRDGVTVSRQDSGLTKVWNIATATGTNIKAEVIPSAGGNTLNVYIDAEPALENAVRGLCGTFNNNAADDYTGSDGTVFQLNSINQQSAADLLNTAANFNGSDLQRFGESWRVPATDSIFQCGANCPGAQTQAQNNLIVKVSQCLCPASPYNLNNLLQAPRNADSVAPANATTTTNTTTTVTESITSRSTTKVVIPQAIPVPMAPPGFSVLQTVTVTKKVEIRTAQTQTTSVTQSPPADQIQKAQAMCAQRITLIHGCEQFDDVQGRIRSCEADIAGLMPPELAYQAHSRAYAQVCSTILISRANEPNPAISAPAQAAATKACMGTLRCDDNCSICTVSGCAQCKDQANFQVRAGVCQRSIPLTFNITAFPLPPAPLPPLPASSATPQLPIAEFAINNVVTKPVPAPPPVQIVFQFNSPTLPPATTPGNNGQAPQSAGYAPSNAQLPDSNLQQQPSQYPAAAPASAPSPAVAPSDGAAAPDSGAPDSIVPYRPRRCARKHTASADPATAPDDSDSGYGQSSGGTGGY